ncbi:MAG: hypothetical protein JNK46_07475, partial [Methylobacteriaceae bacterium]|nr:hypothetical protein [Methylobacteriaceae bacterium]
MRPLRCALVGAFVLSLLAGLAPAAAQTPFPPGWRRLERAPIVLGSGATLTVHLAESAKRGAFLFVTDPLPAAEAGQAWQAIRDRLLGRAQVRQDLGARRETRGERRTRVVEGSVVAGDGKPRRAFGEVQIIAGAPGVWLAGFLNAQDDSEPPQTYEAAANWVVAALPRGAGTPATQQAAAAPKPQQQAAAPPEPSAPQAATAVAPAPAPALAPPPAETRRSLLPAALGPLWRKAAWGGGDFDKQATFGPGGLVVDMPAGARGATGVLSTQTVLRLGEFRPGAAARLTLRFDP